MSTTVSSEPEVRTAAGRVRGRREGDLAVFRGIPFAAPPVGAARFAAPQPPPAWDGVRDAFTFGPPPPQDIGIPGRSGHPDAVAGDDWLTANVWTPDPDPAARRPVFVWIYGGAYKLGFSGSPGYDAKRIAADGDLVVVSFNYRLGIEGFAHLDGAPPNRGLLDQVAALEWVRANVAAFGGDPDRVTICGESAGAGSVAALLAMPSAAGLFRRAIAQSVPGMFFTPALATDIATAIAGERGLRPTAADLSAVDPLDLPDAGATVTGVMGERFTDRWGPVAHSLSPFAPVVDGEILPDTPWRALAAGAARDVDVIAGHQRDEYRLFISLASLAGLGVPAEKVDDDLAGRTLRRFGPPPDGEAAYRSAFPTLGAGALYELVQTDWLFRMPTLKLVEAQVAGGGRGRLYELTWAAGELGSCHGLDGPLLFGTLDAHLGPLLFGPEPSPEVVALSARFRSAWTAFATTGDPGWPVFDPANRPTRIFDVEPAVAAYPEETSRRLWRDHEFTALDLL